MVEPTHVSLIHYVHQLHFHRPGRFGGSILHHDRATRQCSHHHHVWKISPYPLSGIKLPHPYFKAMLLYSVFDNREETLKNVAFKFVNDRDFMTALIRTIEGSIRGFVATKRQAEILALRKEIVESVKEGIDAVLESWGYHLIDLQLNDITFDEVITKSMAQVVASSNLKAAAENEGQALLITKTKAAEAEGNAIKISAEAEKIAAQMRGEGIALFRKEVAKGMSDAAIEMKEADLDSSFLLFSMWTEAIKNFASDGKGNVIFLDGSTDGMNKTLKEMMAMNQIDATAGKTNKKPSA